MQTRAVVFTGVERVEVQTVVVREPGPGELLVRAEVTVISPGTELRCLRGLERGSDAYPYIPGYSMVGHVVQAGPDTTLPVGTRLYLNGTQDASLALMWGGHVQVAVVKEASVFPLAPDADAPDAVFAHLAAIAYRGVRMANPLPTETVAVVGLGPIGQLSLRLMALTGADVLGVDPDPTRVETARRAGCRAEVMTTSAADVVRARFAQGADVVVDATGVAAAFAGSVDCALDRVWGDIDRPGARIVVQGSYANEFPAPYPPLFLKESTVYFPRDCQPQDVAAMLRLLDRHQLNLEGMASEVVRPDDAPAVYARLLRRDPGLLTALIDWN